jgi:integrase
MARGFSEEFGHLKVCELQPYQFEQWLGKQDNWNPTSKAHAGGLILAAVSWAAKKGFISNDHLKGRVDLPTPLKRGREPTMPQVLIDLLISEARQNLMHSQEFAGFLWIMSECGARPIELRRAEAFNYSKGRLIYRWNAPKGYVHKTASKTQRDRIIYFGEAAQRHIEKLVKANPTGPIFRTPRGASWSITNMQNKWTNLLNRPALQEYMKAHGLKMRDMRIYNLRHSAITRWIDEGHDIFVASQVFGTSIKQITQTYGHPDVDRIHEKYLAFVGGNSAK